MIGITTYRFDAVTAWLTSVSTVPIIRAVSYTHLVYAKGALFYDTVRDTIGVRRFDRFLQNYARKYRWQIVDSAQWLDDLRDLPDPALMTLFEEWIRQPAPAVQ